MQKNTASQKIQLFAFDATTSVPKTGDAANITAYVSKDHGSVTVLADTSATEMDATNSPGVYVFDLATGETNADELTFSAKSSTANIKIVPRFISTTSPGFSSQWITGGGGSVIVGDRTGFSLTQTFPTNFASMSIDASGRLDVIKVAGTTQTAGDIYGLSVTIASYIDTEVAAIKTQTDKLTFTVPNKLDANIKSVNDVTVTGVGTAGNPWGP